MNDIDALEKLVLDEDFQELSRILKSRPPNIFRILGIETNEVRWSAFLAWLLDPNEDHGLGDRFLRAFLVDVAEKSKEKTLKINDIRSMKLLEVRVRVEECFEEEGRGDIVIRCRDDNRLCIIENKVRSSEGLDQTKRYFVAGERIQKEENFNKPIYIFLTLRGEQPKCKEFIPFSYKKLVDVLKRITVQDRYISDRASSLIRQFYQNIEEVLDVEIDNEVRDLCRTIYTQHREAIEMVTGQRPTASSFFKELYNIIKTSYPNFKDHIETNALSRSLTLSPIGWQNQNRSYSDVCYVFVLAGDKVLLRLYKEKNSKVVGDKLREKLQKLAKEQRLNDEDQPWRWIEEDTGVELPTDFSDWKKAKEELAIRFSKFLDKFSVEEIEKVPGVKRSQ